MRLLNKWDNLGGKKIIKFLRIYCIIYQIGIFRNVKINHKNCYKEEFLL